MPRALKGTLLFGLFCLMCSVPFLLLWLVSVALSPSAAVALFLFYCLAGAAFSGAPSDYPGPLGGNE